MKLILGSQSENRKTVLERAGYTFDVLVSGIDEKAIRHNDFYELPLLLAKAKAEALLPRIKEPAFLITADQIIVWNGEVREKAADRAEARHFLLTYSGSEHPAEHVNGITVTNTATGKSRTAREISRTFFARIPAQVIEALLNDTPSWNSHAGGYDVKHPLLAPYIRLEGTMDSACGLPMDVVERCMKELA